MPGRVQSFLIRRTLLAFLALAPGLSGAQCFSAGSWPEADLLFRSSAHWLGADSAYSVDLGNDRSLWLFGDSWIDPDGEGNRSGGHLVRNTIGIQDGPDPSSASIDFHWSAGPDGVPSAFFAGEDDNWFWPGHGARVGDRLILFLNRMRSSTEGLGFESAGWAAVVVENPDDHPDSWSLRQLDTAGDALGIQLGFAGTLVWQEHLYAFGTPDPVKTHPLYVARWPLDQLEHQGLAKTEWWGGPAAGWIPEPLQGAHLFDHGQSELTIHRDPGGQFLATHTRGFGPAEIVLRSADRLTGPWSAPQTVFEPPERDRPNVMIYAGKAHPQLAGADLVLTYATNTFVFAEHFSDEDIYYPHFVRLNRCD